MNQHVNVADIFRDNVFLFLLSLHFHSLFRLDKNSRRFYFVHVHTCICLWSNVSTCACVCVYSLVVIAFLILVYPAYFCPRANGSTLWLFSYYYFTTTTTTTTQKYSLFWFLLYFCYWREELYYTQMTARSQSRTRNVSALHRSNNSLVLTSTNIPKIIC